MGVKSRGLAACGWLIAGGMSLCAGLEVPVLAETRLAEVSSVRQIEQDSGRLEVHARLRELVLANRTADLGRALAEPSGREAARAYVEYQDEDCFLPDASLLMLAAARAKDPKLIELLIATGFDPNEGNRFGESALIIAARNNPNPGILMALLAAGSDVTLLDGQGQNLLHQAAQNPQPEILKRLIALLNPDQLHAADSYARTPLHMAAKNPAPQALDYLFAARTRQDLLRLDGAGQTPLHLAAHENPTPSVTVNLLAAGASPMIADQDGNLPLHLAAEKAPADVLKLYLAASGREALSVPNKAGDLPLHLAAQNPDTNAVRLLLAADSSGLRTPNLRGELPLHLAAGNLNPAVLEQVLAAHGAKDLHQLDGFGRSLLHHAAGVPQNLRRLLALGATEVNLADQNGMRPLHLASQPRGLNPPNSIEILLAAGADPNTLSSGHFTPLALACYGGSPEIVASLLAGGAAASLHTPEETGATPLHYAAYTSRHYGDAIVKQLLAVGAGTDLKVQDESGFTPLFQHVWNDDDSLPALNALLAVSQAEQLRARTKLGEPLVMLAVRYFSDNPGTVAALLARGTAPDLNYVDEDGMSALHLVADRGKPETLRVLLAAGLGEQLNAVNQNGNTPLHLAAAGRQAEVIRQLLAAGADPKRVNEAGKLPLELVEVQDRQPMTSALRLLKGQAGALLRP